MFSEFENTDRTEPVTAAEALGMAVIQFSRLESMLEYQVSVLLFNSPRHEDEGHLMGVNMGYRQKVELLGDAYRYRFPDKDDYSQLNGIVRELRNAGAMRNRLVHWELEGQPTSLRLTVMRPLKKGNPFGREWVQSVDADEIFEISKSFEDTYGRMMDFVSEASLELRQREKEQSD